MKKLLTIATVALSALCMGLASCNEEDTPTPQPQLKEVYKFVQTQPHTAIVNWDPQDYNFMDGNKYYLDYYKMVEEMLAGGCSSWRNGYYHGRNLDWMQANYGCLVIRMPKGNGVKHASVATLNGNSAVTHDFIRDGVLTEDQKKYLPCVVVDGINDAGVTANINIVPHDPANTYIGSTEGDLSSQCVVRFVLDNAGSVKEAISLLEGRVVRQSIVGLADDETHYMISDPTQTAVVEFINKEMKVTYYTSKDGGYYSPKGNPAIMTNMYNYAIEKYGLDNVALYDEFPYSMGVERWATIKEQYATAKHSVEANLEIAKSVWFFDNFMAKKTPWYTENAVSSVYGRDAEGFWYKPQGSKGETVRATSHAEAMQKFYDAFMPNYWAAYDTYFSGLADPHVKGNDFWETSHSVIYDIKNRKGYLYPFENRYITPGYPCVELSIP